MTEDSRTRIADRRSFLKLAGAGVATAGGALAAGGSAAAAEKAPEKPGALYRETDHIRKYYELARG